MFERVQQVLVHFAFTMDHENKAIVSQARASASTSSGWGLWGSVSGAFAGAVDCVMGDAGGKAELRATAHRAIITPVSELIGQQICEVAAENHAVAMEARGRTVEIRTEAAATTLRTAALNEVVIAAAGAIQVCGHMRDDGSVAHMRHRVKCHDGVWCPNMHFGEQEMHSSGRTIHQWYLARIDEMLAAGEVPPRAPAHAAAPRARAPAHAVAAPQLEGNRQICTHWQKGTCNHNPCSFWHPNGQQNADTASSGAAGGSAAAGTGKAVCKYFVQGSCFKGTACTFLHPEQDE